MKGSQIKGYFLVLLLVSQWGMTIAAPLFGGAAATATALNTDGWDRRFQAPYSFKSPFYVVRGSVPFWLLGGATVITDEFVRLTPAQNSRSGRIWGSKAVTFDNWEVEATVKIGSTNPIGADGMAIWYVEEPNKEGPAFGHADQWKGLAVTIDTFDNDRAGDNPSISIFYNDGSWKWNAGTDGKEQKKASCTVFNLRNNLLTLKITHIADKVQVMWSLDRDNNKNFQLCGIAEGVNLPVGYYFGLTAETGGVSDNHDIYGFQTARLTNPNEPEPESPKVPLNRFGRPIPKVNPNPTPVPPAEETLTEAEAEAIPAPAQENSNNAGNSQNNDNDAERVEKLLETLNRLKKGEKAPEPEPERKAFDDIARESRQASSESNIGSVDVSAMRTEIAELKRSLQQQNDKLNTMTTNLARFYETFADFVAKSPKRDEIKGANVDVTREIAPLKTQISEMRSTLEAKVSNVGEISRVSLDNIQKTLQDLRGKFEETNVQQRSLHNTLREKTDAVNETIERTNSWWSYLLYFVVFQVVLAMAFMYWKKFRDEKNKKLY